MLKIILLLYLGILSIYDGKKCKVPLIWLILGLIIATVTVVWDCLSHPIKWQWIAMAALLGTLPGLFMLLVGYITRKVGYGDGLVLIAVGILVGYRICFLLVCFSLLLMSVWCMILLLRKKGNRNTRIPYLPFLTAVYLVGIFV